MSTMVEERVAASQTICPVNPRFHIRMLCASAVYGFRPLRIPASILAASIILSTMTTGWHYFSDVLGGVLLAIFSLSLAVVFTRRCDTICPLPSGPEQSEISAS